MVQVGEDVGFGLLDERAGARRHRAHRVDGGPVRRPHGGGVRLAEDRLHRLGRHRPMALGGRQGADVALEVDGAALPAGARQALGDGAHEARVGVADDEADAREPALAQAAQEAEPARVGLGVDRRDAEHAAHAVGADADRGDDGRGPRAALPPALDVSGVEEQVRHLDSAQAARRQLADLGVERSAHGADLVLREPLYSHLAGDPLHLPRRHAVGPRLRDGHRPVGARVALDHSLGEVGPGPQLGYAQGDVADGGGQTAPPVAVARVRSVLAQHVRLRVHHLVHHRLEQGLGELPHVEKPVAVGWELL